MKDPDRSVETVDTNMARGMHTSRDPERVVFPSTAFAYLWAVKKFLEENGIDTDFFED